MDTSVYRIFLIGYIVFQVISIVIGVLLLGALILSIGMLVLMGGSTGSIVHFIFACTIVFMLIGLTFCYICLSPIALFATYKILHQRPLNKLQRLSAIICPVIAITVSIVLSIFFIGSLILN